MTRKRFIKLVMSCGVQKRTAQKLALHYHSENFSYKDAYSCFCVRRFKRATLEISVSCKKATEALSKLAKAFCELGAELREAGRNPTVFFDGRATDGKAD